jgi:hypothetical protein
VLQYVAVDLFEHQALACTRQIFSKLRADAGGNEQRMDQLATQRPHQHVFVTSIDGAYGCA